MPWERSARATQRRAERISDPVAKLRYLRQANYKKSPEPTVGLTSRWRRRIPAAVICAVLALIAVRNASDATGHRASSATPRQMAPSKRLPAEVWVVESNAQYELYSNGLRIENRYKTSNQPRAYVAFNRRQNDLPAGLWSSDPVGIVYHTTESHGAPFEAQQNQAIRRQ